MAKTKISEYSSTANSNTDIASINIDEGCAPSGINNAIRALMAQLKNFQTGADGDSFNGPVGTTTPAAGAFTTLSASGVITGTDTTDASSTTAAAVKTAGGLAVAKKLYVGTGGAVIDGLTVGKGAGAVSSNTAVGASALAANTTANYNTAVGYQAAQSSTTGDQITAVGALALKANTAAGCTAVGEEALTANTTGVSNTAVGQGACISNTTGQDISSFGRGSLFSNTTGSSNTAIGRSALFNNTTASNSVAVGYQAGYTNQTGGENTFVGNLAGYTSNANNANVGNTCIGARAGYALTTGVGNTFVGGNNPTGSGSGQQITTGSYNTIVGGYSGNAGGLDIRTSSNYIVLSDGAGNPRIINDFNGWTYLPNTPTTAVAGNMYMDGGTTPAGKIYRSTSALKYKQDIRDLEDIDINLFRPIRYKSKCDSDDQTKDHLGFIADWEAEAGHEELVTRGAEGEIEGFQYERMTAVLTKTAQKHDALLVSLLSSIQELNAKVEAQAAEIAALKGQA